MAFNSNKSDLSTVSTAKIHPSLMQTMGKWTRRSLMSLAALGIAVTGTGAIYQAIATKIDQYNYPPPGKLVQVNNHKLHILTMGENQPGPTVVLESGLGGPLTTRITSLSYSIKTMLKQ
jgi:hypothetical protein